ncbi:MAG: winged helix-turn-helix domain-containing protein [Halofilum sp. (in: g-proteobacteria)]|nr:winged helix-turn-helix domain-containing protein [Halofilum sp. (in: g-proteobacteria)]
MDWTPEAIEQAREHSRGWLAGFRLMLSLADGDVAPATPESSTPRVLLDYLEREFLATAAARDRRTARPDSHHWNPCPASACGRLAGEDGIERLDALVYAPCLRRARGVAATRCSTASTRCSASASETWRARTRARHRHGRWTTGRTAEALAAAGDTERAVDLWLAAGHYEQAVAALRSLAPRQLAAGRFSAARRRLAALPEPVRAGDPWLGLWHATAHIPVAPAQARAGLLQAYRDFRAANDREGAALAWAGTAESLWVEWGDYESVAWLLDELDWLAAGELSAKARARLGPQAVLLLGILRPHARSALEGWIDVARRTLVSRDLGAAEQLTILHTLLAIDVWLRGAREHGDNLLAQGRRLEATVVLPPLQQLMWRGAVASHRLWFADDPREAIAEAETGLGLARDTDVHQWDFQLNALAACGAIAAGERESAAAWLAAIEASGEPDRPVDAGFHAWIEGWAALRRGDTATALARAHKANDNMAAGGPWNAVHLVYLALAQAERIAGDPLAAWRHARTVSASAKLVGADNHRWIAALTRVHLLLEAGETHRARRLLRAALALGERRGYLRLPWWPPEEIATLCSEALHAGVTSGFVRRLAASNGLDDWHPGGSVGDWPWPLRIHALDGVRVLADSEPVEVSGKGAALLQLLATESTGTVDQARLTDMLWPDVDGDRARRSLDTTLHRLRQRLGRSDAIRMHGGRIELNPAVVWTDLRALRDHLDAIAAGNEHAWRDLRDLLVARARARLQDWPGAASQNTPANVSASTAEQHIGAQTEAAFFAEAMDTAEAVLAIDGTAERLCHLGLQAAQHADDPTRAHRLYNACRAALERHHGTVPSARTETLYRDIVSAANASKRA